MIPIYGVVTEEKNENILVVPIDDSDEYVAWISIASMSMRRITREEAHEIMLALRKCCDRRKERT